MAINSGAYWSGSGNSIWFKYFAVGNESVYRQYTFYWDEAPRTTANYQNNTTTINWRIEITDSTDMNVEYLLTMYAKINNVLVYNWITTSNIIPNAYFPFIPGVVSGSITVENAADGSLEIPIEFAGTQSGELIGETGTWEGSSINLAAKIKSADNFYDTGNPTITYENSQGSAVTSLQAAIISELQNKTYASYRDVSKTGTSYTFNLTETERNAMRNAAGDSKTLTVYFVLKTVVYGKTYTDTYKRTCTISDAEPIITATVTDVNSVTTALTGDSSKFIRYYSNAKYSMTATAQKGATIKNTKVYCGSYNSSLTSDTFDAIDSGEWTFTATDSRGVIGTLKKSYTLIDYVNLTCNFEHTNPTTTGEMTFTVKGNYFNGSFGAVTNTLAVQYRYKIGDGSYGSWTTLTPTKSGNTYSASSSLTGLDYKTTYTFQCRASDKLHTSYVYSSEVIVKSLPVFHWGANDFTFETDVNMSGDLRLKGTGNYGNKILFGDGEYVTLFEATDDALTIKASTLNLQGKVNINGIESGTWTPALTSSGAVSSYNTREGWYQRIGNCVTIGWNLNVTCNSGYSSTAISIGGAPFFPSVSAMGGGVMYNAYVNGGFCFEGWVIEGSGGAITPRLQPCNNSSANNINISSTAYYPYGGGSMTLSGTICYMTDD